MKNCKGIKNFLEPYLLGDLAGKERLTVERHLAECPNCTREVESLQKVLKVISLKQEESFPKDMLDNFLPDLHKRLAAKPASSVSKPRWSEAFRRIIVHPKPAVRLATVVVALVIGIMIGKFYFWGPSEKLLDPSMLMVDIDSLYSNEEKGAESPTFAQSLTRTEVLFLEIVNLDTDSADKSFDIASAKIEAVSILNHVRRIYPDLQNRRKAKLSNALKTILLELANTEENEGTVSIKRLRSLIIEEGLLTEVKALRLGRRLEEEPTRGLGIERLLL